MCEKRATAEKKRVNYYPFGLKHKGYNNVVNGVEYNYKNFQGQELTKDLDLNVLEFKFRIHDPAIGRFWQVDPLAEDYVYNQLGDTGACRHTEASLDDSSLDNSCFEVKNSDNLEHCQALCSVDTDCKAIEVNTAGTRCEIWTCTPEFTTDDNGYNCQIKEFGNLRTY